MEVLSAAYAGLGIAFRLGAVARTPADDATVQQCGDTAALASLATRLLLGGGDGGNGGNTSSGSSDGGGTSLEALHVFVCEPAGVNGASAVLGGGGGGGGAADAAVVLRRSALWESRTSLVHQVGASRPLGGEDAGAGQLHAPRALACSHSFLLSSLLSSLSVLRPCSRCWAPHRWDTTSACPTPSPTAASRAAGPTPTPSPTRRSSTRPTRGATQVRTDAVPLQSLPASPHAALSLARAASLL